MSSHISSMIDSAVERGCDLQVKPCGPLAFPLSLPASLLRRRVPSKDAQPLF